MKNWKMYSALIGFITWIVVALISGRSEAWDSGLYWILGLPVMAIGSAVFGYFIEKPTWRAGLWVGIGQGCAIFITGLLHGSGFGLFPLTIIATLLLSLPLMVCAAVAGVFSRQKTKLE